MGRGLSSTLRSMTRSAQGLFERLPFTITIAADCWPRISPPAAWPASSAASNRSARSPSVFSYAMAMAGQTFGLDMRLACTEYCAPMRSPAAGMHFFPVHAATSPRESIIATCLTSLFASCESSSSRVCLAPRPLLIIWRPRGP